VTRGVSSVPLDRRGVVWGLVGVAVTLAITFVGSDGLAWFDAALVGYLFGVVFMVFGVIYRYTVWVRRPPTAMLNRRGWDAFRRRRGRNLAATFWFPVMIAIGIWRHLVRHVPLRYEPAYWALVFPIGMYGAATFRMRAALSLDTLEVVPEVTLVVAIAAWSSAFAGLLHHLATNVVALRRELRC
jgi:hypothetical protein